MLVACLVHLWGWQWLWREPSGFTVRFKHPVSPEYPAAIAVALLWHCGIAVQRDLRMWTHSQPFPCMHVFTVVISMKNCNHGDDDSHSNASGKEVQLSKTAEFFLTARLLSVKGWLLRRRQLLNDQWWQSIEEKAAREEFSHIKPNRAWSQDCPGLTIAWQCLTCLDGLMCCRGTGAMIGVEEDGQSLLLSWQWIQGKAPRRACSCWNGDQIGVVGWSQKRRWRKKPEKEKRNQGG